jgi:hypothetical protein
MVAKRKNQRGSNLDIARKAKAAKAITTGVGAAVSDPDSDTAVQDPDYAPIMHTEAEDEDVLLSELDEDEAEPGKKRRAARDAAAREGGAAETRRLDEQASRVRRHRQRRRDDRETDIRDAVDGTLLAKKLAMELEPVDPWVAIAVAEGEPVRVDDAGQWICVLGAVGAGKATAGEAGAGEVVVGEQKGETAAGEGKKRPRGRRSAGLTSVQDAALVPRIVAVCGRVP